MKKAKSMNGTNLAVPLVLAALTLVLGGCGGFLFAPADKSLTEEFVDYVTGADKRRNKEQAKRNREKIASLPLEKQAFQISPGPLPIVESIGSRMTQGPLPSKVEYTSTAPPEVVFRRYDEHFRSYGYRLVGNDKKAGKRTYRAKTYTVVISIEQRGESYAEVRLQVSPGTPKPGN